MRRVYIFLLLLTVVLSSCDSYLGGIDDYNFQYDQLVFINKCSEDLSIIFDNPDWLDPGDTIKLKPTNGVWKRKKVREGLNLPRFEYMQLIFGKDKKICFDTYSLFAYNPCVYNHLILSHP